MSAGVRRSSGCLRAVRRANFVKQRAQSRNRLSRVFVVGNLDMADQLGERSGLPIDRIPRPGACDSAALSAFTTFPASTPAALGRPVASVCFPPQQ